MTWRTVVRNIVRGYDLLVGGLLVLAGLTVAVAFVMIIVDVTLRSLGVSPPSFTIATVEYSLLYLTMFAAPYLVRHKAHVCIDAVITRLPVGARRVMEKFIYLVATLFPLLYAYLAFQLLVEAVQSGFYEERGLDIPLWILYWPIPLGFTLVSVEFARYLFGFDTLYGDRRQTGSGV